MRTTEKVYKTLNSTEDFVTMKLAAETAEEEKILDSLPLTNEYLSNSFKGLRNVQKHGNSYQFIATK